MVKERAKVIREKLGLLHRGEESAPRHPTKAPEVGVGAVSLAPK